jgi:uncharacterized protein (DUF934 family)
MPRRLLRNGQIVEDEWLYFAEAQAQAPAAGDAASPLILSFDQWQAEREQWIADGGRRLGVVLSPAHKVEQLAPDLARLALVGAEFSGPGEGRGYTQGRLLRERWKFAGELRATGYVHRDQLFFLARCGFNSFELPDADLQHAYTALSTFSAAYQPSNDAGLPLKLRRRLPDTPASA